jgi:hypothetical protein
VKLFFQQGPKNDPKNFLHFLLKTIAES